MSILLRIWAIFIVAVKRLFAQRWLAVANIIGLTATVALAVCIPQYSDGIYYRILQDKLAETSLGNKDTFVFMFRYIGSWAGPIDIEDLTDVDEYLTTQAIPEIGLPGKQVVRYYKTDRFELFPEGTTAYGNNDGILEYINFGFASDFQDHITLIEGTYPQVAESSPDSTVEVLMSEVMAEKLGVQVGEYYQTYVSYKDELGSLNNILIPIKISGVWKMKDVDDDYWFYPISAFKEILFVPEETFTNRISPFMDKEVSLGLWYLVTDSSNVNSDDVDALIVRTTKVVNKAAAIKANTNLSVSPIPDLQSYREAVGPLTILLYAFSVPIIGLILVFLILVVGLSVSRQINEIAILRSRGATPYQIIGISALEGLILGIISLILGILLGSLFTFLISKSRSFLDFSLQSDLRLDVTLTTFRMGLIVIALGLVAQILPALGASRHTIVTYKQERARMLQKPFWQRAYIDFLLLIPVIYGTYILQKQGSLVVPSGEETTTINSSLSNPLFFLIPALGALSLSLIILRVLPYLMSFIAWITSRTKMVGVLLAARHLSRTPGNYSAPLVLLILTLSLSAYTASLAKTLDQHLSDKAYYQYGSDINLKKQGESKDDPLASMFNTGGETADEETGESLGPRWVFLPISDYTSIDGVAAAARVGNFKATTALSDRSQTGTYVGVDRADFTQVSFWRNDFSDESLGGLMNKLALTNNGVLVAKDFLDTHYLKIGDTIQITVYTYSSESVILDFVIVGTFDLFPTWYKNDSGALFIGNLEYIFEEAGGIYPYSIWLKTKPEADKEAIINQLDDIGAETIYWETPDNVILKEQQQPERQGLFGVLSVGFIASALLTVLGFLFYAFFSFRRRFIELGVLRAVGLSAKQMTSFLAWELAFLIFTGLGVGTGLGILVSKIYIPYLQIGTSIAEQTPPFVVCIAWGDIISIYGLFGILFFAGLAILAALLMKMKIFQAIKLGEVA